MDHCDVISELIKLNMFNDQVLSYLITINKNINIVATDKIIRSLTKRHQQCVSLGDKILLPIFYSRYMTKMRHMDSEKWYDFCRDCHLFGNMTLKGICRHGCVLKCCDIDNIIPTEYDDYWIMECGCHVGFRNSMNQCECGNLIINNIIKCTECGNIPFRYRKKQYKGNGLLNLVALGAQDLYLSGNPKITFF